MKTLIRFAVAAALGWATYVVTTAGHAPSFVRVVAGLVVGVSSALQLWAAIDTLFGLDRVEWLLCSPELSAKCRSATIANVGDPTVGGVRARCARRTSGTRFGECPSRPDRCRFARVVAGRSLVTRSLPAFSFRTDHITTSCRRKYGHLPPPSLLP